MPMKTTTKNLKTETSKPKFTKTAPRPTVTVYIGNLKYERDERDIKELFSEFGKVKEVSVVMDPETEMSKGIAFVKMYDTAEANTAIKALNGAKFDGRTLKVSIANDRFAVPTLAKTDPKSELTKEVKPKTARVPRREKVKKQGLNALFNYLNTRNK